ncbi:MAG: ankyrin repeat domain-containing protein, partial [Nannocystaceae bacterium]
SLWILLALATTACLSGTREQPKSLPQAIAPSGGTPGEEVIAAPIQEPDVAPETDSPQLATWRSFVADGGDIQAPDGSGWTPLHRAAQQGDPAAVRYLIDQGAALDARTGIGDTPLLVALDYGKFAAAHALLDAGAAIETKGAASCTPLYLAARGSNEALLKRLLDLGATVDSPAMHGQMALHAAAKEGCNDCVRTLIAAGSPLDHGASNDGFTPLHHAAIAGKPETLKLLLASGASLDPRDHKGRTALHWAVYANRPVKVHVYAKLGEPHDTYEEPAGEPKAVLVLLDAGANIDAVDKKGNTPLHEAAALRATKAGEALLARGANPSVKNQLGETAQKLASARGLKDFAAKISAATRSR